MSWFQQYNLPPGDSKALADTDGDGHANWEERIIGSNPTNAASRLEATGHRLQASGRVVSWSPASGRLYSVYYMTNLLTGSQELITDNLNTGSYTDSVENVQQRFYRIGVRLE